ncbi:MAG: glycosyltransferase family 2 protein [Gaiellaceae bacterium]|jgi:glycosyltransferase involved in cell wall biosynthesis
MHPEVYVVIPVYNEAPVIRRVVTEVLAVFSNVVCVNDGSTDNSAAEISTTAAVLINHPINLGQGAALQTGLEYALSDPKAECFVTFDSDGQHRVEDAVTMLEILKKGDYDVVLGSRFLGKAENMPLLKRLVLKAAVAFSNATSGIRLTDAHNGLRAFNRAFAEDLEITIPQMAHATEITHCIAEKHYRYLEVPVTIRYTDYSLSKGQSALNAVNISFDLLMNRITRR